MNAILVTAFVVREADLVKLAGNVPVRTWLETNGPEQAEYVSARGFPDGREARPDDGPETPVWYLGLVIYSSPGKPVSLPSWWTDWNGKIAPVLTAVSNWMESLPGKPLTHSHWGSWLVCQE